MIIPKAAHRSVQRWCMGIAHPHLCVFFTFSPLFSSIGKAKLIPCPSLVLIKDLSGPVLLTSLTWYLPEAPLSQDISLGFFTPWHLKKG